MKKQFFLFIFIFFVKNLFAQNAPKDGISLLLNMNIGVQVPAKEMAKRFGFSQSTGLGLELMSNKQNWILGGEFDYFFGKNVKENTVEKLYNTETFIYGIDKAPSSIFLRERGFVVQGYFGKLIPFSKQNNRNGIRLTLGLGYLQHKIRLQDDSRTIAQFDGAYETGYDRLTGGLNITQFVGYQYLSDNRRINFTAGFNFSQGFTKSLREWDFGLKGKDTSSRLDLLNGFRVTWILPFYIGDQAEKSEY